MQIPYLKAALIIGSFFFTSTSLAQSILEIELYYNTRTNTPTFFVEVSDPNSPAARCDAIGEALPQQVPFNLPASQGTVMREVTSLRAGGGGSSCNVVHYGPLTVGGPVQGPYNSTVNYEVISESTGPECELGWCQTYIWGNPSFGFVDALLSLPDDFDGVDVCSAISDYRPSYFFSLQDGQNEIFHQYSSYIGPAFLDGSRTSGWCGYQFSTWTCSPAGCSTPTRDTSLNLNFSFVAPPVEPPEVDECVNGNSPACCRQEAQNACATRGGLYSYHFGGSPSFPSQSCSWTCNDDLDPDDIPPPSSGYDYRPFLIEANTYLDSIETINRRGFEDLRALLEGIEYNEPDLSGIESSLDGILDALSDLLAGQISFEDIEGLLDGFEIEVGDIEVDLGNLEAIAQAQYDLLYDAFTPVTDLPDPNDFDLPDVPGVDEFGNPIDYEYWSEYTRSLLEFSGIDTDVNLDTLSQGEVNLDDITEEFSFDFSTAQCPSSWTISFMGNSYSLNTSPFCDLLGYIGYVVVFSAYFMVPFIVFGGYSKR